jgi:hypothetical protein
MEALALCLCLAADPLPDPSPGEAHLLRFPSRAVAERMTKVTLEHEKWCTRQKELAANEVERDQWNAVLRDAARRRWLWNALESAHMAADGGQAQRAAFEVLEDGLGTRAWWHGVMPSPVPYWRAVQQ